MSVLDSFLALLTPYDCLTCGEEGALLCESCLASLPSAATRCYRCQRPSPGGRTCAGCRAVSSLGRVGSVTLYKHETKTLLWHLKAEGAQAAAQLMARQMVTLLPPGAVLLPVPTTADHVRQRGYDQARLLARQLGKQSGLPWRDCLVRVGHVHQIGADRTQRLRQLTGAFRVKAPAILQNAHIVLVDDVVTTGATLTAAAAACLTAGARRVDAVTFAQAPLPGAK